jgi:hypothetical protein
MERMPLLPAAPAAQLHAEAARRQVDLVVEDDEVAGRVELEELQRRADRVAASL